MRTICRSAAALSLALVVSSCTMKEQEAPPLAGPSEFGTSLSVRVTPDILQLDGASQAQIIVTAFNENGQPKPGQNLRADIMVNGEVVDFGRLSQRSVTTGADGRAVLTYTAPAVNADTEAVVDIAFSVIGDNFMNATGRTASIRLVPTGIRVPPSDLVPRFTVSPGSPAQGQAVLFDASTSDGTISQYRWDFGDGRTGSGETTTNVFSSPGTYFVRLTLMDPAGRSASTTQTVTVGQGQAPVATFTYSPTDAVTGDVIHFNASESTPAPGRSIVSYQWNFGDGTTASGPTAAKLYTIPRTYTVTLTVTDDIGRSTTTSRTVTIAAPDDDGGQPAH